MSNEKDRLRNEEKQEMERILRYLSDLVACEEEVLKNNYLNLIELDKIFAKAMLGISYNGSAPIVNDKGIFDLKNARHPLLKVEKVIPNNIDFGKNHLGIVITGPNTGGKTVLLKTVGLLSLMVKFGLLIPADESSNIMIFDHIFCDIGDDQSIVENLSTFSSHMKKMVAIVNQVTPNSLALFDEIGSGTDPVEGAQIAISVLNYFVKKNVSFITTTHYAELKAYAYTKERVVNASMAFNEDTMEPTYHLVIGKSGSSNALSIAKNLGLKQEIIDSARHHFNTNSSDTRTLINNIEKKVRALEKLEEQYKADIKNANQVKETYEKKLETIDKEKEKVLNNALKEADKIVQEAVLKANILLDDVKELQNKGVKLHEIIEAKAQIDELESSSNLPKPKKKKKNLETKVGDRVFLIDYQQYGTITRIRKDKSLDVEIGNISVNVFKEDVEVVELDEKEIVHNIVVERNSSTKSVSLSLDLRGARFSDAKDMLDKYIDDLLMANIKSATIIHGFGTGTIREMVQDFCRKSKYIDSYRYGVAGEGGLGVTVITLK
jgi:DNA mismatch repair protein MutS2